MLAARKRQHRLRSSLTSLAIVAPCLLVCLQASAQEKPRLATVVTELSGTTRLEASWAETALTDALTAKGYTLIDSAQAQAVRQVNDAGALVGGAQLVKVTTTLDADYIVAVVCRLEAINTDLLGPNGHRYDAEIQARLIDVGTGQVDRAFSASGRGTLSISKGEAMRTAGLSVGSKLGTQLLAHLGAKHQAAASIELSVRGIPNVTAAERVIEGVRHLPGVTAVNVNHQSRQMAELAITAPHKTAREIALALDQSRGLGVTVFGYSKRTIKADYSPEAATALHLLLQPFKGPKRRKAKDAWLAKSVPEMLTTALSNRPYLLIPTRNAFIPAGTTHRRWPAELSKRRIADEKALVLTGTYTQQSGSAISVTAKLVSARTGATILSRQATCSTGSADEAAPLADCLAAVGEALGEGLMPALLAKRHLFKNAIPTRLSNTAAVKPLRIGKIEVAPIIPTQLGGALGHVRLVNRGKATLSEIVLRTEISGFTTAPVDMPIADLAPGAERRVPLTAVLDRARLAQHDTNESAALTLSITYRADDLTLESSRAVPAMVYDRNTVTWSSPDALAAFVTPRSDTVQTLARQVAAARPVAANDPVSVAASLLVAMNELGLKYQRDPVHPYGTGELDYVQFPRQTLARRGGDCDDLAILYASLAEAVDLPVLLVTTPDHIFVAAFTGMPAHNSTAIHADGDRRLLVHNGMAWLPLETTRLDGDVDAAWSSAVNRLDRYRDTPGAIQIINVRNAWGQHPAVDLAGLTGAPPAIDAKRLAEHVATALTKVGTRQLAATDAAIRKIDTALKLNPAQPQLVLRKGVLLVMSGRYVEAEAVFRQVTSASKWQMHALNNAGNVRILDGDPTTASTYFARAIALDTEEPRLHINAAVAAHIRGDQGAFDTHVIDCLLLPGGETFVARLNQAGVGQATRASEGDIPPIRADTLRALFLRAKRPVPTALKASSKQTTRAADATPNASSLHNMLYWLW